MNEIIVNMCLCVCFSHLFIHFISLQDLVSNVKDSAIIILLDSPLKQNDAFAKVFREKWEPNFQILYTPHIDEDKNHQYYPSVYTRRYGHDNRVKSKAQVAVLRKKQAE